MQELGTKSDPDSIPDSDYEEAFFTMLMHAYAAKEGKELLDEQQALPRVGPSPEACQKLTPKLDEHLENERAMSRKRRLIRVLGRLAACLAVACVVFVAAMTTVQAFRARVMNLWMDIRSEYTDFRLQEHPPGTVEELAVTWTNAYVPTYVPEEYMVESISTKQLSKTIVYENDVGSTIVYKEYSAANNPTVDTEDADSVDTVSINGHDGVLVEKRGWVTVIWGTDGLMFMIQAQTDIDTALRVAQGVRFVR